MRSKVIIAGLVLGFIGAVAPSFAADGAPKQGEITAQDLAKATPAATFEIDGKQLRLLVGGATGKGVLRFQGKDYPFTAKGASVGGVGFTEVNAKGDVYYLNRIEDFPGTYTGIGLGATIGKGKGASAFQNTKGVVAQVKSRSDGLALGLGVSALNITMDK